jgi:hypothetical protein
MFYDAQLLQLGPPGGSEMTRSGAAVARTCWGGRCRRLRAAGCSLVAIIGLLAAPARADDYSYPYDDPYFATITIAILNANGLTPGLHRDVVHVPVLPGRNAVPSLEGRGDLSVALYRQRGPAPLLFILSGIGSNPYFGLATYIAEWFHQAGFHVVILPSPMNWNFALAASRSGAPGYTPADARDLYEAMRQTLGVLDARYDVKTVGITFLGLSLGALEGAYLSVLDGAEQKIGIDRYLLINPPTDLAYALAKLDTWSALGAVFGQRNAEELVAKAQALVEDISADHRYGPEAFATLAKEFSGFTRDQMEFLIAEFAKAPLPELICVTRAMHEQHVRSAPKEQTRDCLLEAKTWTFMDYGEKIAAPLWRRQEREPSATVQRLIARASLDPILEQVAKNRRVRITHNADDILAEPTSLERLKEAMGNRMILYPRGGHLGNVWYPANKRDILSFLGAPLRTLEVLRDGFRAIP